MPGRPPNSTLLNFWEALHAYPPAVIRLAARATTAGKHVRALSHREIAITANIPLARVLEISQLLTWEPVLIGEAKRFCEACGFDPTNAQHRRRQCGYLRKCQQKYPGRAPHYLRTSPLWSTEILPLIQSVRSQTGCSTGSPRSPSPATKFAA
jgi:hypothetical protein